MTAPPAAPVLVRREAVMDAWGMFVLVVLYGCGNVVMLAWWEAENRVTPGDKPVRRTRRAWLMTVGWPFVALWLAAMAVYDAIRKW